MKKINYNLLMLSSDLENLGIQEITKIKHKANYKEKRKEYFTAYDGRSTVPVITSSITREGNAKEELVKTANKDKSVTEKLLFSTNIVYFDDKIFKDMLKSSNVTKEDMNQIVAIIDNVKSLQKQQIDSINRYHSLIVSHISKTKQLFDLKKNNQNTGVVSNEIDSMKNQLLELKKLISSVKASLDSIESSTNEILYSIYDEKLKIINKYYGTKNMYWLFNKIIELTTIEKINSKKKTYKKS